MKIFVSYSRENREDADHLVDTLEKSGHVVWIDKEIAGGDDWWQLILESIEACDIFVFVMSRTSVQSMYCKAELRYALDLKKPLLPVRIEEADFPFNEISRTHYVDATRGLEDREVVLELVRSINRLQDKKATGSFPQLDRNPPRPELPKEPDPLSGIREKVQDIRGLSEDDLAAIVYQLKQVARTSDNLSHESRDILSVLVKSPHIPQGIAQEIRETLNRIGGNGQDKTPQTVQSHTTTDNNRLPLVFGVVLVVVIGFVGLAMLLAGNGDDGDNGETISLIPTQDGGGTEVAAGASVFADSTEEATPEVTHEATPETTPEMSVAVDETEEEATPEVTAEITAEVTPEATENLTNLETELAVVRTEDAATRLAQAADETESANMNASATAESRTATATLWTPTPTADLRGTAEAIATQDAQETRNAATQRAEALTATADSWTATPTPTPTLTGGGSGQLVFYATTIVNDSERSSIYTMSVNGINRRQITSNGINDFSPTWSPDGSQIAYHAFIGDSTHIYIMNSDGSDRRQLTTLEETFEQNPAWSPDGRFIAFSSLTTPEDIGEVYMIELETGEITQLTDNYASDQIILDWSPDGSQIVFASAVDGDHDIYLLTLETGEVIPLTDNDDIDWYPQWSPDGERILFHSNRDSRSRQIYVMDADGSNVEQLTNIGGSFYVGVPSWSPDGTQIAFINELEEGNGEIFMMNADGSDLRRITDNSVNDFWVRWRP